MKNGYIIDYCGLDTAEKYNGLYIDLCGMDVQDYINATIYPCCGGGDEPSEPSEPTKKVNTVVFSANSEKNLMVYANYAPLIDIEISCVCEGSNVTVVIPSGNGGMVNTNYVLTGDTISISQVTITPSEDDSYKYGNYKVEEIGEDSEKYTVYYGTTNKLTYNNVTSEEVVTYKSIEATNEPQEIIFKIKAATEIPSDEEYEEWETQNTYLKVIVVPSVLYVSDSERSFDLLLNGEDAFIGYENIKTLTINGENYYLLVETDELGFINDTTSELSIGTYNFVLK